MYVLVANASVTQKDVPVWIVTSLLTISPDKLFLREIKCNEQY